MSEKLPPHRNKSVSRLTPDNTPADTPGNTPAERRQEQVHMSTEPEHQRPEGTLRGSTEGAELPHTSVIIPVKNAPGNLERLLHSLAGLNAPPGGFEIVVCDNGSTDETPEVARRLGARVLILPGLSVAGLRNEGAQQSRGKVLAFVDSDCEVGADWLRVGLARLTEPGVKAAGAYPSPPEQATWVQQLFTLRERVRPPVHDAQWLPSMNLLVRRQDFQAIGGFDASLKTCEDVDFCYRLRASGGVIRWDSSIAVVHHGEPESLRRLFQKERWHGRDNYRGVLRHGLRWEELPSLIVPVMVLGSVVLPIGALVLSPVLSPVPALLTAPLLTLPVGLAVLTGARVARAARRWDVLPQLSVIYLVYFSARAAAVVWGG